MEQKNLKLSELLASPFCDTEETLEIKRYAKSLVELDDFKNLKLYCVQYNDSNTLKKKLKLSNIKRKTMAIISFILPFNGVYNAFSKKIVVFIDNQIKYGKLQSIIINISKLKLQLLKKS